MDIKEQLRKEKLEDFDNNIVDAIIRVSQFYNIPIDEVKLMPMPRLRLLIHTMEKIKKEDAIILCNQIAKMFGAKGGNKTFR